MIFRKAIESDISAIDQIYRHIHSEEESGRTSIGWIRDVYPTRETALAALHRNDLFVAEENGKIFGAAIINQIQVDCYRDGNWKYPASDKEVMVLHTLVVSPDLSRKGLGSAFVKFYEEYAAEHGCSCLRMDTNAKNMAARSLYRKLGYREIGVVPCVFNGIPGVDLVLLEKKI